MAVFADVPGRRRGWAPHRLQPAVLFWDDVGYEQFDQLACTLRRRGIAAIRLNTRPQTPAAHAQRITRRVRDRLFYDRRLVLDAPEAKEWLRTGRIENFELLDVLLAETAVAEVGLGDPRLRVLSGRALAFGRFPASQLLDKFEANILIAEAGLAVPRQITAVGTSAASAAGILGLPFMVKPRIGLGGDSVSMVRSVDALERTCKEADASSAQRTFYQSYVRGAAVGYACVRGPDGPLLEQGFRIGKRQWEFGPSAEVSLDNDARLLDAGRRVAAALGCRGFVQVDFIEDADGQLWVIEANLRPWGNAVSLLSLGIDFAEAYAALLLGRRYQAPSAPSVGQTAGALPFALYQALRDERLSLVAAQAGALARMCRRGPGLIYGLIVAAKAAALLIHRLTQGLARRKAPFGAIAPGPEFP